MARIQVEPGLEVNCDVDDYLWPWMNPLPVLLQHGFSRNAGFWRRWIPTVSGARRVYRPDMRGCGKSDVPPAPFTIDADIMLSDVLQVMDTLGLERVHWVGEASGGILGLLLAHRLPERVASLTMLNSPTKVHAVTPGHALDQKSSEAAILKYGMAEWCRRTLPQRVDLDLASPELQEFVISEIGKTPDYIGAEIQRYIETLDTFPLLRELKIPVFLLSGVKKTSSVGEQRIMEREIPDVRVKLLEGYGTAINLLAPEICAREALQFWATIDAAAA